jgi:mono/diheme cytochrome c family protein
MKSIIFLTVVAALIPLRALAQQKATGGPVTSEPGKAIFTSRCGTCHDADASKKLPDGTTLLARLATNKDPETRPATRLKNEQERHQVFLYLQPRIERARLSAPSNTTR